MAQSSFSWTYITVTPLQKLNLQDIPFSCHNFIAMPTSLKVSDIKKMSLDCQAAKVDWRAVLLSTLKTLTYMDASSLLCRPLQLSPGVNPSKVKSNHALLYNDTLAWCFNFVRILQYTEQWLNTAVTISCKTLSAGGDEWWSCKLFGLSLCLPSCVHAVVSTAVFLSQKYW